MHLEEVFNELAVADLVGIESNEQRFCVSCCGRADFSIARGLGVATSISYSAVQQALSISPVFAIQFFQSPETATGEDRPLSVRGELHRS